MWQFPKSWPCPRAKCSFSEDSIWPRREAKESENKNQNKKAEEQVYEATHLNYQPNIKMEQLPCKAGPLGDYTQIMR